MECYLRAVNQQLERSHNDAYRISADEIWTSNRCDSVKQWCNSHKIDAPNKRAIASHLLDQRSEGERIADSSRADLLRGLHDQICKILDISSLGG